MRISIAEQKAPNIPGTSLADGSGPHNGYMYGETEDYYFEPECPPPVADFVWDPTHICTDTVVYFFDTSTSALPILSWAWDFGDSLGYSSLQNPTYTYGVVGTYDVTASAFAYLGQTQYGVVVTEGAVTLVDFALDAAPTWTVDGTVTDATTGWPLYAEVDYGPGSVWTDPETGYYSVDLPEDVYVLEATAWVGGYREGDATRPRAIRHRCSSPSTRGAGTATRSGCHREQRDAPERPSSHCCESTGRSDFRRAPRTERSHQPDASPMSLRDSRPLPSGRCPVLSSLCSANSCRPHSDRLEKG